MSEAAGAGGPLDQVRALAVLAARLLHAPWAVVALVDGGTCTGTSWVRLSDDAPPPDEDAQRRWGEAVVRGAGLVVPDLKAAPAGTVDPGAGVRAWAGAALHTGERDGGGLDSGRPDSGSAAGVLAVADDAARRWTPADLEVLGTLAAAAAAELVLHDARRREHHDRLARQALADATDLLLGSLDPQAVLVRLTALAVPGLAHWCTVWVPEGGALRVAAGAEAGGARVSWPELDLAGGSLSARAYRSGTAQQETDLTSHLDRAAPGEAITERSAQLRIGSSYAVPLVVRGAPVGVMTAMRRRGEPAFTPADLCFAEELAARAAVALSAVLQHARQRHTAEGLQRSLLPVLPVLPELDLASAYRPAGGTEVGGDFFDAVDLGAGRVAVCIGDVMGRGVRAAAVMGQLRTAVRAYARLDVPPGRLLGQLNGLVDELADAQLATCFYGVLDVAAGTLTYASAGHLAPLLRREGAASVLAGPVGAPLGCDARPYAEAVVRVQPGDLLCLFTDGLVEDRSRDLDEGLRLAAEVLSEADDGGLAARCERLLEAVAAGEEDDVALLLVRLPGAAEPAAARVRELEVPGGGTSVVGHVRHWAGGTVRSWHADEHLASTAALVVSELVTNALLHGLPPVRVRLRSTTDALSVEVFDEGHVLPDRGGGEPDEESGRGLLLVEVLSRRWGTRASGEGKVVWAELPLPGELPEDVPGDLPVAGPEV